MKAKYESLSAAVLKDLAKTRKIKGISKMKKSELIEAMLKQDEIDAAEKKTEQKAEQKTEHKAERAPRTYRKSKEETASEQNSEADKEEQKKDEVKKVPHYDDAKTVSGILEVLSDGYGFIRSENYLPGENDVYVSPSQIRKFNLKTGDIITGKTRKNNPNDKFGALLFIESINGYDPEEAVKRTNFEDLTPVFPNERIVLERKNSSVAMRIVDLLSPIGKGQRGMIVSQPKAGKTTLLKEVAKSVKESNPEMHLIILLIDERPEEVTDMKEAIEGDNVEVIYSTFDELPEHHKRVSEMVIERAKRLVEHKKDVMILLDSITRLARAYNLTVPPSGRTLSGGLDPAALHMPKRFFGAARNMREGGSLTVLATALVDTGSKMDDVVFEEFKGTGNMELVLDRKLSEKRVFPAIDLSKSSTRRDDLLLTPKEMEAMDIVRKGLTGMRKDDATESVLNLFTHTQDNNEFVHRVIQRRVI
ncbi:MAG: transcription termination factor Rho [Lachnospiraceae bacterium]|nr:transcription termination factor Rho [Lachnospiraceae bacterium]